MSTPTGAVFLSYASQDAEAAQEICNALRAAGIEVWLDQSELRGGDAWDRQIRKHIHDCALFIPLISQHSQERLEGYFRLEWKLAVDRSHRMAAERSFIVPVVVDSTRERDALVPDSFRDVQWTHLPSGEASPAFVARVAGLLGAPAPVATAARASSAPVTSPSAGTRKRRAVWIALGLAALTIIVGGGWFALQHSGLHRPAQVDAAGQSQPAITEKSIAVLPFADLSERHDQEYFADGMTDDLTDVLAKLPGLKVIGRTSSFQFKGKSEDLRTIGAALGAQYIVQGSVRKAGSRIRVTAQLIDAPSNSHIWADSYDREFDDVLDVQDRMSKSIARALQLAVGADDPRASRVLHSTEAYILYLRGRSAFDRGSESYEEAQSSYEAALAIDPTLIQAQEALLWLLVERIVDSTVPARSGWPLVKKTAGDLQRLDTSSSSVHLSLAMLHGWYEYDWNTAKSELDQAMALRMRDAVGLTYASHLALTLSRREESNRLVEASMVLDPLNPMTFIIRGFNRYFARDFAGAERDFRRCLEISPSHTDVHGFIGMTLLAQGKPEEALKEVLAESPAGGRDFGLAIVYNALGRHGESDAALERFTRDYGDLWLTSVAEAHALRGERDQAIHSIDKAIDLRSPWIAVSIKDEPNFDSLRDDPRFEALLRKMNLAK